MFFVSRTNKCYTTPHCISISLGVSAVSRRWVGLPDTSLVKAALHTHKLSCIICVEVSLKPIQMQIPLPSSRKQCELTTEMSDTDAEETKDSERERDRERELED